MKVRFQADADFNQNIVRAVRRRAGSFSFQRIGSVPPLWQRGVRGDLPGRHAPKSPLPPFTKGG